MSALHGQEQDPEESKAGERLASSLMDRQRAFRAADTVSPYAIRLGASNAPVDCTIFSSDYRYRLPEDDPVRKTAPVGQDAPDVDLRAMEAAHAAGLRAARKLRSG